MAWHGLEFRHRLLCVFHLVVGQANDGGIRNICWLLELCQLDRFIATSYGAQQKIAASLECSIEKFGQEERSRLAQQMPHREITLCEDETFHPQRESRLLKDKSFACVSFVLPTRR